MTPSGHRKFKGIEKGEVRDHMTGLELAFINVAEQATIANTQVQDAQGYEENYDAAEKGGRSAGGPLRKNTAVRSSATNPISSSGKVWRRVGTKLMSLTRNNHLQRRGRS
jgi:hypothetical protein